MRKREARSVEYDIRACAVRCLMRLGADRKDIRIEIPLDTASSNGRADIVLLRPNGLFCVELKSGRDTFETDALKTQLDVYRRCFDAVALIADKVHRKTVQHKSERHYHTWETDNWNDVHATYCHDTRSIGDFIAPRGEGKSVHPLLSLQHLFRWSAESCKTCVYDMLGILWADEIRAHCGSRTSKSGFISEARQSLCLNEARKIVCKSLRDRPLNAWEEKFWSRFNSEENIALDRPKPPTQEVMEI